MAMSPGAQRLPSQYSAAAGSPYGQPPGYMGPYSMSQAPPPMNILSPSMPYSHGFAPPAALHVPDAGIAPQNPYGSPPLVPPHMQPHPPIYQLQRHPSETLTPGSSHSFPNSPGLAGVMNQPLPSPRSASPSTSQAPTPSHNVPPASYGPHTPYYPQVSGAPYTYSIPAYTQSPVYQTGHYPVSPFGRYPSSSEPESPGQWWFVGAPPGSNVGASYPSPYPGSYSSTGGGRDDSFLRQETPPTASAGYPSQPLRPQGTTATVRNMEGASVPGRPTSAPLSPRSGHSSAASGPPPSATDRAVIRRPYHPSPPSHRSEWVMWVGNVPSDTTHDELWRFFTQSGATIPVSPGSLTGPPQLIGAGVQSIFLIARSSCAFVNLASEAHLQAAIAYFDGRPVRPDDPRCPRLVCRVRRKEDDLKAGVGGQRGTGIHMRYVKEQRAKDLAARALSSSDENSAEVPDTPSTVDSESATDPGAHHGPHPPPKHGSSGSGSFASTSSSVLSRYFPQRYFILKSLTQYDLDLSVERGLWATQKHNEDILDKAYRTSKDVFLIFGVNKSGEFYGYARMAGPIHGEGRTSWASGTDASSISSRSSRSRRSGVAKEEGGSAFQPERTHEAQIFFSPGEYRLIEESPMSMSPDPANPQAVTPGAKMEHLLGVGRVSYPDRVSPSFTEVGRDTLSAPGQIERPHHTFSSELREPERLRANAATLLAAAAPAQTIELDEEAPIRALRDKQAARQGTARRPDGASSLGPVSEEDEKADADGVTRRDHALRRPPTDARPDATTPGATPDGDAEKSAVQEAADHPWGGSFKVEWIRTERLPFWRTRHLRNPWNQDREVKVSRDGTELEPGVGQALLEEWDREEAPTQPLTGVRPRRSPSQKPPSSTPLTPIPSSSHETQEIEPSTT
ncbi:hypothetical protein PUNSTDRAFT_111301 [Punctularia strigosozonata HHB-11173 SS5]|uniref:uncharacterized protein n=1 Tax=Punctularia strigosozonata (strain HHB-11173) TaxID=741275 RepID=UPI00044169C9|nr:uncharacterized protein PUNSTDRAFT_111301 [Punctularia strigosozonata HHB-11173 SS5]EIN12940.1 hypothetical protein PUNSTDRAFT_111301 [Punctularia strigosozonata HHB-11173 SS5]